MKIEENIKNEKIKTYKLKINKLQKNSKRIGTKYFLVWVNVVKLNINRGGLRI